jgi:predicted alpha/beta-fold hydrolase
MPVREAHVKSESDLIHTYAQDNATSFQAAWWCRSAHLQTIWPYLVRGRPRIALHRERLELPDGDFLDLDWTGDKPESPIVLVLHGLEGSSRSKYAAGLLCAVQQRGWRGAVMHFRGCSGEPNRLARGYHSGETGDLAYVVNLLRAREPDVPLFVVGYSLGGNALLKWLGEQGTNARVDAAVAVSVPFLLNRAADRMEKGLSRIYQWELMQRMRRSVLAKSERIALPIDIENVPRLRTFREFDDGVTAPLHDFAGVDDYYRRASARQYLGGVTVSTLVIHSLDDPFMSTDAVPTAQELSSTTTLELYPHGGHVGFVSGALPWRPRYWLEQRIPDYLAAQLRSRK